MIDFDKDTEENKVLPIISNEKLMELQALHRMCYYDVARYMYPQIGLDFECITAVDYSDILQKEGLKRASERLIENKSQYNQKALTYLMLRNLIDYSWKLNVPFLIHLTDTAEASLRWGEILRSFAQQEGLMTNQPYWLRNEQSNLLHSLNEEEYDMFSKVEIMMIKSNRIFPKCSVMGANQFIQLDSGTYPFLKEWIRIVLCGYRVREFNEKTVLAETTEPIRIGATLMLTIANIIQGKGSVYLLPEQARYFSKRDPGVAKEIISHQLGFLLGHEYGHIHVMNKGLSMEPQEEELFADKFGFDLLKRNVAKIVYLVRDDSEVKNDIQSENETDRKIEAIELLFLFYDMYFYASELLGYPEEADESHPYIETRRNELRKFYSENRKTPLIEYADELAKKIKGKMVEEYERSKCRNSV